MKPISRENETRFRTFVAANHSMSRLGLVKLIEDSESLALAGVAANGRDASEVLSREALDAAVIDIELGDMTGHELVGDLRSRGVNTPVLLIAEETSGDLVLKGLGSGATGYITTSATPSELIAAICRVAQGLPVLGAAVGAALIPELRRRASSNPRLTERELDILSELATGGTAKEIAERMNLAVPTIKNHIAHLYAKLGVSDRGAAVAEAMRQGWLR